MFLVLVHHELLSNDYPDTLNSRVVFQYPVPFSVLSLMVCQYYMNIM